MCVRMCVIIMSSCLGVGESEDERVVLFGWLRVRRTRRYDIDMSICIARWRSLAHTHTNLYQNFIIYIIIVSLS